MIRRCVLSVLLIASAAFAVDLSSVKDLPKPVYWYERNNAPTYSFWLNTDAELQAHIVRICRTRCARLEGLTSAVVERMYKASPSLPIGLNCSPALDDPQPEALRPSAAKITATTLGRLATFKAECDNVAKLIPANYHIKRILVDWEQFRPASQWATQIQKTEHAAHDLGLAWRVQAIHDILRTAFPSATQEWYQAGQIEFGHGWEASSYGAEFIVPAVNQSCTLYAMDRPDRMRTKFELNLAEAKRRSVAFTPIIALGAQYRTGWVFRDSDKRWVITSTGFIAGLAPSWAIYELGLYTFNPWRVPPDWPGNKEIQCVAIYPGPGDPRYPDVLTELVRLSRGANQDNPNEEDRK